MGRRAHLEFLCVDRYLELMATPRDEMRDPRLEYPAPWPNPGPWLLPVFWCTVLLITLAHFAL